MGWRKDDDQDDVKAREEKEPKEPEESKLVCAKQSDMGGGGGKGGKKLKGCLRPPCKGKIINTSSGATAGGSYYPTPCGGMAPQMISWAQLQPYLVDPQMILRLQMGRPAVFVTEGWQAEAQVRVRLIGDQSSWSQDLAATLRGRLDFGLPLVAEKIQPGRYTLEMNGLRLDGGALRVSLEVADEPAGQDEKPTREGPDVVRLDPDHLLVYGFVPDQPFRLNVYTLDPTRPWEGGTFLGSAEFEMPAEGHRVIDLDFAGQEANAFCFLAEGWATVPVIVGLRGTSSLDFFEPENGAGCPDA